MTTFTDDWKYRGEGNSSLVVANIQVGIFCSRTLFLRPKVGRVFSETPRPTVATSTTFERSDTAQCSVSTSESRRLPCANIFASYGCILPYNSVN